MAQAEYPQGLSGDPSLGQEIARRIGALGAISETPDHLTRIFLTPEHRAAAAISWSCIEDQGSIG